jgi:hypothetical protein
MSKLDQLRALREARYVEDQQTRVTVKPAVNNERPVNNAPAVINSDAAKELPLLTSTADRQRKWRAAHFDLNRQRAREGMRRLRAKQKEAAA